MSIERDELIDEIAGHTIGSGYYSTSVGIDEAREIADDLLAAGYWKPRTITTVEELDTLPIGTTIFWAEEAWLRVNMTNTGWKDFNGQMWTLIVSEDTQATVLHEGDAA